MATWRAENSILTQRGVEILNKIKAGVGSITITKIVAGSERVAESQLYLQTAISGTRKNMTISSQVVSETGVEIAFYIENKDFTEAFPVHQIGVYVTHPDYTGEQLYHISQCDAEGFDIIPKASETPLTQGYSIFLEHGNSESISLSVDPSGMVSIREFDLFRNGAVPGNFITIDENKRLIDTGVKITDAGGSSRNLLHNWYLVNPIDTKNGCFVTQGTSYYSDKFTNDYVDGTTGPVPVVVTADGFNEIYVGGTKYYVKTLYVRQGYATGVGSDPIISFDRWVLFSPDASSSVTRDDNGCAYLTLAKNGSFYQEIASTVSPAKYGGKTYTLTAKIEQISSGSPVLFIYNGKETFEVPITNTGYAGYYSVTGTIDEDSTEFTVGIKNNHASQSSYIKVSAMKVEVGTNPTLAKDPPADKAEQMAICIQFDPNTDVYRGFPSSATANILAEAVITE